MALQEVALQYFQDLLPEVADLDISEDLSSADESTSSMGHAATAGVTVAGHTPEAARHSDLEIAMFAKLMKTVSKFPKHLLENSNALKNLSDLFTTIKKIYTSQGMSNVNSCNYSWCTQAYFIKDSKPTMVGAKVQMGEVNCQFVQKLFLKLAQTWLQNYRQVLVRI